MSFFDEQSKPGDMLLGPDQVADGPHPYAWILHDALALPLIIPAAIVLLFGIRVGYAFWKMRVEERAYRRWLAENSQRDTAAKN